MSDPMIEDLDKRFQEIAAQLATITIVLIAEGLINQERFNSLLEEVRQKLREQKDERKRSS